MSILKEKLDIFYKKCANEPLDETLYFCMDNLTYPGLYIEALGVVTPGFCSESFKGDFFKLFGKSGKVKVGFVGLGTSCFSSFTWKPHIVCVGGSSHPHFLTTVSDMIRPLSIRGLIPAGVTLPLGFARTTPMVTSSNKTFWADTFPLCDGNCRTICRKHPDSHEQYIEIGQEMWGRFFNIISSRFLFMFIAQFVEFVSQICVNPAILADLPIISRRYLFGMVTRRMFEDEIPFLPPKIRDSAVMSGLTSFFRELETVDGEKILVPESIIIVIKPDLLFTSGQRKRINDLGTGGFLRKLCARLFQESPSTTEHLYVLRRVLNKPYAPKLQYFVRKTRSFCGALKDISQQSNDGGLLVRLLQMLEEMLEKM